MRAGDRIEVIADDVYGYARPRAGNEFSTITVTKHGSTRVSAEAVRVATGALRQVAEEAERVLPDPADREVVVAAYLHRLARVDLAGAVVRAAASGDEGAVEVFGEVGAFLRSAPPGMVGRSWAVLGGIVLPPIALWRRLPTAARAAAWSMISTAVAAGRGTRPVPPGLRAAWWILAGIGAARRGPARPVVDAILALVSLAATPVLIALARARQTR
jgi:hypothetical protein